MLYLCNMQFFRDANRRIMDIQIEDDIVVRNLDVFAAAGGPFMAHVIDVPNVIVLDNIMTITFISVQQYPMISGIEIFQSTLSGLPDDDDDTATSAPTSVPTTYLETLAPVTSFPTASPLTLPPDSPPTPSSNTTSFRDLFINCGGTFNEWVIRFHKPIALLTLRFHCDCCNFYHRFGIFGTWRTLQLGCG